MQCPSLSLKVASCEIKQAAKFKPNYSRRFLRTQDYQYAAADDIEAQTTSQPGSATGETLVVSAADAAAMLKVTPQAIRKLIVTGKLNATKHRGAWRIFPDPATVVPGATETDETPSQSRNATSQLALHEEQQAMEMAVFADAITAPLRQRIEELNRKLAHVKEQPEMVMNERDELRAAQEATTSPNFAPGASEGGETDGPCRMK
jgi:hypothetical protein